jgi:5-methylcytosine-specific restriction endonuclease McrA
MRECRDRFGFSTRAWDDAVRRGDVITRPRATPLDEFLVQGKARGRDNLKLRLLRARLKNGSCEECGISTWRGKPLSLALHHLNGNGLDNRLENLSLLCPNCHSQTPNFGVKNVARA